MSGVAVAVAGAIVAAVVLLSGGDGRSPQRAGAAPDATRDGELVIPRSRATASEPDVGLPVVADVDPTAVVAAPDAPLPPRDPEEHLARPPAGVPAPSPGAPTDAQVRLELKQLQGPSGGARATVLPSGEAVPPANAPPEVKQLIAAANAIARTPYIWGGGHARLYDRGYDCTGSLSFAFIHAGLLDRTMAQGWSALGEPGPGRWISIYYNAGHVFIVVAGMRYDTSALRIAGSRWTTQPRSLAGFGVRHIPGL